MKVINKVIFSMYLLFIVETINTCPMHAGKSTYASCAENSGSIGEMENCLSDFLKDCFKDKNKKKDPQPNSDDGYDSEDVENRDLLELEADDTDYESDTEAIENGEEQDEE